MLTTAPAVTESVYSLTRLTGIRYCVPVTLLQAINRITGASKKMIRPVSTYSAPKNQGANLDEIAIKPNIIGTDIAVTKSNEELTEAIKNFQKEEGLTIDGIAGNEVWRKIDILMLNKVIEDD